MFRLIGWSKYWVLLCFLLFSVASCNAEHTDVICAYDDVLNCVDDATAYITGKRKKIDDQGDVIGEESCQKDFAKASQQLNHIKTKVQKTYTGHQMARHQRNQLSNALTMIKESIEAIPSGPEQTKLIQLCNELIAYISSSLRGTAQGNRSL